MIMNYNQPATTYRFYLLLENELTNLPKFQSLYSSVAAAIFVVVNICWLCVT